MPSTAHNISSMFIATSVNANALVTSAGLVLESRAFLRFSFNLRLIHQLPTRPPPVIQLDHIA
eukprot:686270-Pyramimonas_sp.AAC.2